MGRRRHGQWPEPGKVPRHAVAQPKHDSREAVWEAYVRYDDGKRQLSIAMAGWAMGDQEIDHWCTWFGSFLERVSGGRHDQIWAKEVNFAENQLTAAGARRLLETLAEVKVYACVLKLHHNQLEDGACVADYVTHCQGSLRELHLSHNEMSTEAAAEIILAAASVTDDSSGAFCYPCRSGGHSAAPLWLRLEQNYVAPAALANLTDSPFEEIRSGKVLCNVSSRACTPHCCVKHRIDPPPVHAKHLSNQRTKTTSSSSAAGAKDLLTILRSGVRDDAWEKRQKAGNGSTGGEGSAAGESEGPQWKSKYQNGTQGSKAGSADADAGKTLRSLINSKEPAPETVTIAKVLRWDEDLLKWVRDVIEIPEAPQKAVEDTGRIKLSLEVGNQMGNELKNLLGGNRSSASSKGSAGMNATSSDYSTRAATDDEPEHAYRTNRRGRRGSQPSGSEVKQVNSTMLNPQAKEFIPSSPQRARSLELNLQAATLTDEDLASMPPAGGNTSDVASSSLPEATSALAHTAGTSSALNPEAEAESIPEAAVAAATESAAEGEPKTAIAEVPLDTAEVGLEAAAAEPLLDTAEVVPEMAATAEAPLDSADTGTEAATAVTP